MPTTPWNETSCWILPSLSHPSQEELASPCFFQRHPTKPFLGSCPFLQNPFDFCFAEPVILFGFVPVCIICTHVPEARLLCLFESATHTQSFQNHQFDTICASSANRAESHVCAFMYDKSWRAEAILQHKTLSGTIGALNPLPKASVREVVLQKVFVEFQSCFLPFVLLGPNHARPQAQFVPSGHTPMVQEASQTLKSGCDKWGFSDIDKT